MIILLLYDCRSTHFHIRNKGKIRNLLSYNACSTIIHALISCRIVILYCIRFLRIKRIDCKDFKINARAYWQNRRVENTLLRFKTNNIGSKVRIESHMKYWCLHINRIIILHWRIYVNWLPKKESLVNTRLGTDHHHLIMPPISMNCSNTFLERSFIYSAPCDGTNWVYISEHQKCIVQAEPYNNVIYTTIWMLTVNVYIIVIFVVVTVNYWKCILLYIPLNLYIYVHWIMDFK